MPRQPLSRKKPNACIELGPGFLTDEAATLIGHCAALWSEVDLQYARVLAALLGSRTEPAVSIFQAIRRTNLQTIVLTAAAEATLPEKEIYLFIALRSVGDQLEGERNDLMHGLFGRSGDLPDCVLWIEAKKRVQHMVEVNKKWASGSISAADYRELVNHVSVYTLKDLRQLRSAMEEHHRAVHDFASLVAAADTTEREGLYRRLSKNARIRAELPRTMKGREKSGRAPT